ncbi:hypothetical protein [Tropicimonas isoalkanivorans]|uniref:Lipoprotein n=1 Tax=Tropicimonas isoalkanivorans TaxID=441112 RepID=A0A1I1PZJ0_9RHOB|nr:hypothetical protein [Tropicimonas isoalkanivorans]SFD11330.1 hypothetical protein SAMN04488094_115127 [Tropicimonas isoalkanivorans]
MLPRYRWIAASLIALAAAGCETTTPPGKSGGTEQLRASMTPALRSAGVPDFCIEQLSLSTLAQVKGITGKRARSSMEALQRRQQIRAAASKDCGAF